MTKNARPSATRPRAGRLPPEAGPWPSTSEVLPPVQVPDELLARAMNLLELPPEKMRLLNYRLFSVLTFESWLLARHSGPSERSRSKAKLGALARSGHDLLQLVRSLDDESLGLLAGAMVRPMAEGEASMVDLRAFDRALITIVNTSRQGAMAKLKTGKAPDVALDNMISQLAWIYEELTGRKLTHTESREQVEDDDEFRERKVASSRFGRFVSLVAPYVNPAVTGASINAALARAIWTGGAVEAV